MIKAPAITSLRVSKLAANFLEINWDNVGGNFYYIVERRVVSTTFNVTSNIYWEELGYTPDTSWFDSTVTPGFTYQYRVRSTYTSFEPSDWVESDSLTTFTQNAYIFTKMNPLLLSNTFIDEKFIKNNQLYVDFNNDVIYAGLMGEDFVFDPLHSNVSSVENHFVVDKERHEIQGNVKGICKDRERTMICEIDGVLYLFERFQPVIRVSNDKGQNWVYYSAFNGRIGNPVARQCTYQSDTTTYVLGYNEIFFGRPSTDIRWSEDDVRFSTNEYTFAKLGDDTNVGFPVEIFGKYIDLPPDLNKRAEAMACSNNYLYVAGRNYIRRTDISKPTFDEHGNRIWEDFTSFITTDPEHRSVTKKLDVLNGTCYALVSGRVKLDALGNLMDPTKPDNVEQSEYDGVYIFDDTTHEWTRVFGNTEEERSHIDHIETNMSTDGKEVFFTYWDYSTEIIPDADLPLKNPDVKEAVKYSQRPYYASDKMKHYITFRSNDRDFQPGPSSYHGESQFVWSYRSGTRTWITPRYRVAIVYPTLKYEYQIDPDREINSEVWDNGIVTLKLANVNFNDFSSYANGVLFYRSTGEIIGYYEFNYRIRDTATIFWRPDNTFLTATLVQQEIPPVEVDKIIDTEIDPDLRPLLNKMAPEHYMYDDGLFRSFASNYLEFLSSGESSYYNVLKNLIRNKYPKEDNNFEYLYSEINKRNIYLDKEKRDAVVRFFETRNADFYSAKGVIDSYKFLFALLYDADVDIEVESLNSLEYDIVVTSGNITEDIVGTTVYTPTGRANVTYIEREYVSGKLQWRVTIHNLIGKFIVGQVLKSEVIPDFNANIIVGVRGKELTYSDIDYINRGRVYYTMKIKSELPLTRYRDDILRFVHPVGFGFIGITMITVLINAGISMAHKETIMTIMKSYRWDAGVIKNFPETTYKLSVQGNIEFDPVTGEAERVPLAIAGQDPIKDMGLWPDYDTQEQPFHGVPASERRKDLSPSFDAAWVTYAYYSILAGERLKDRIGLPRDPKVATQIKVEK